MTTLTVPIRWLGHTMRAVRRPARLSTASGGGGGGGSRPPGWYRGEDDGGPGGVREPRRPKRTPPAGAMALPEPDVEGGLPEGIAR